MTVKSIIVILLFSFSSVAFSETERTVPDQRISRAVVVHEGVPGFWFERDVALGILADLQELLVRRQQVSILQEELSLRGDQFDRMNEIVQLEQEVSDQAIEELERAERRASLAEESRNKWWRSPLFLFSSGVIITVVLEVVALIIFRYVFLV